MRRWLPRILLAAAAVAAVAVLAPRLLADDTIELTATFEQVGQLVPDSHVRFGDVPVGTVRDVRLTDDHRAEVVMDVDAAQTLPQRATAVLRMTALLGERYIDLAPVDEPEAGAPVVDGGRLPASTQHDLELVVAGGSDVVGAIAAGELGRMIDVGHRTLAGRGDDLGALLDDLAGYVGQLDGGRRELADFIDASSRLGETLAPEADRLAGSVEDLGELTSLLADEEERAVAALDELGEASDTGARILADNRESLDDLLTRASRTVAEVLRVDSALENALLWLPRHNLHVPGGVVGEQSQILVDVTVCGVDDEPDDPSNSCDPPNPGVSNDPPEGYEIGECILYNIGCEGFPEDAEPHRSELEAARTTPEERARKMEEAEGSAHLRERPRSPAPEGLP